MWGRNIQSQPSPFNPSLGSCNANMDEIYVFLSKPFCSGNFWMITVIRFLTIVVAKHYNLDERLWVDL